MSIQSEVSRVAYAGNNSDEHPYPVPFYFFDETDLVVVATDAAGIDVVLGLNADYVVSGTGNPAGGSVVTLAAVPSTSVVTIYRDVAAVQQTSYEEADAFPAKSHERALDRLTMLCQQVMRAIRRSYRVRESDGDVNEVPAVPNSILGLGPSKQPRTYTAAELAVWLNLTQQFFGEGTKTWLVEGDRALAVPDFLGQVGVQLDDSTLWVAYGTTAGEWTDPTTGIEDGSITTAKIVAGALSADSTGRAKMADAYITLSKIAAGVFTADATGRGKFDEGFVDESLLASGAAAANLPAGVVLQTFFSNYTATTAMSTTIPWDNTVPQSTEGTQIHSVTITPSSANSKIRLSGYASGAHSTGSQAIWALFKDSSAGAFAAGLFSVGPGVGQPSTTAFDLIDAPATTSPITYKVRVGPSTGGGGALTLNASFGGTARASFIVQEIKG